MIAIEARINGELVARAGRDDMSVLSSSVACVGVLGPQSHGTHSRKTGYRVDFHLGGLTSPPDRDDTLSLHWGVDRELVVGDVVELRLVETSAADDALIEPRRSAEQIARIERERWESSRDHYFSLRAKYETAD